MEEINNLDQRLNLKIDDFEYESHFAQKYSVTKLKSYLCMLKDFNLGYHMFYDEPGINKNDFEDDMCDCRNDNNMYNCKINTNTDCCSFGKWNYRRVLEKYPKIKKFIEILAKKLQHVNSARLKLEEKTLNIFYNDLKNIDQLVIYNKIGS